MTRRMSGSEIDTYTILGHNLFPQKHRSAEEMAAWCEENFGPMDEDWSCSLRPTEPGRPWEMIWVFRHSHDAMALTLRFRGS